MNAFDKCGFGNHQDDNGNPAGGWVQGTGLRIDWQNGPLGRDADRKDPNGAFVETVISAVKQRIEWYQTASNGKFKCVENTLAISHLEAALNILNERTKSREDRKVEGTHAK